MFRLFAPKIPARKRKQGKRQVFRMFKRMPDGRLLIAGFVTKYPTNYAGARPTSQETDHAE